MSELPTVKFWVNTCPKRRHLCEATMESVRASDIGDSCELVEGLDGWNQKSWDQLHEFILGFSKEADFTVRLEDDVIVNKHIMHNVQTWAAITREDFGLGWLFLYDGFYYPKRRTLTMQDGRKDLIICTELALPGSQGIVYKSSNIEQILAQIMEARKHKYATCDRYLPGPLNNLFDSAVSWATQLAKFWCYMHDPSLVNCHEGSRVSADGSKHEGHFANKTFDLEWKRPVL
jgi:hypothetical protein